MIPDISYHIHILNYRTKEAPFKCSEAICFCVFFSLYQHVRRHCIGNKIDLSLILCIQQTYFLNIYIFAVV